MAAKISVILLFYGSNLRFLKRKQILIMNSDCSNTIWNIIHTCDKINIITQPQVAALSFWLCSCFFVFSVTLNMQEYKINLNARCLWCLDCRVVSMLESDLVDPCLIPGGCESNFFLFFFFSS